MATATCKLRISPQFWTSDEHEVTRGLRGEVQNSHFTPQFPVADATDHEAFLSIKHGLLNDKLPTNSSPCNPPLFWKSTIGPGTSVQDEHQPQNGAKVQAQ